jgi:hypothetical protein
VAPAALGSTALPQALRQSVAARRPERPEKIDVKSIVEKLRRDRVM